MSDPIYDPNVPQFSRDRLSVTQPQFQNNMLALFAAFIRDHVSINDTNAGNHTVIRLLQQIAPIETEVSEINVFTKQVEDQTAQTFLRYQGNGQEIQFTNYQLYALPQTELQTQYFTSLPGGIMLYFGSFIGGSSEYDLNIAPAVCSEIITAMTCPYGTVPMTKGGEVYKPYVRNREKTRNGKLKIINFVSNLGTKIQDSYYIVMAKM